MSGRHTNIAEGALNTSSNSDGGDRRGVGAARTAYFFVAILVGLGVIVVFSVFFHPSPHGPISLTFTGFVNVRPSSDAPAGKLAVFLFTNGAPTRICYFVESIEHQTTNGWFTNTLHRTPKEWRDFGVELGPFESRILHVPPPTNGVWRLRLGGNERATGIKGFRDWLKDFSESFDWRTRSLTAERFEGKKFEAASGEVTE